MSNAATYQLIRYGGLLSHFRPARPALIHDEAEDAEMLLRARIRSGDYLMTLATELERVADALAVTGSPEAAELQRFVTELLYLERNYKLTER